MSVAQTTPAGAAAGPSLPNPHMDTTALHILLAEPDAESRERHEALLLKCKYRVTAVKTSKEALDLLRASILPAGVERTSEHPAAFDLVLKEHEPPEVNGHRLLKKISKTPQLRHTPVIVMSSQDDRDTIISCLHLGAADYLVKPLRENELRNLWTRVWWRKQSLPLPAGPPVEATGDAVSMEDSGESGLGTRQSQGHDVAANANAAAAAGAAAANAYAAAAAPASQPPRKDDKDPAREKDGSGIHGSGGENVASPTANNNSNDKDPPRITKSNSKPLLGAGSGAFNAYNSPARQAVRGMKRTADERDGAEPAAANAAREAATAPQSDAGRSTPSASSAGAATAQAAVAAVAPKPEAAGQSPQLAGAGAVPPPHRSVPQPPWAKLMPMWPGPAVLPTSTQGGGDHVQSETIPSPPSSTPAPMPHPPWLPSPVAGAAAPDVRNSAMGSHAWPYGVMPPNPLAGMAMYAAIASGMPGLMHAQAAAAAAGGLGPVAAAAAAAAAAVSQGQSGPNLSAAIQHPSGGAIALSEPGSAGEGTETHARSGNDLVAPATTKDEQRRNALDRYRKKRNTLCFSKKIRYASRKQLAEQRPRSRGQFVKTTPADEAKADQDAAPDATTDGDQVTVTKEDDDTEVDGGVTATDDADASLPE